MVNETLAVQTWKPEFRSPETMQEGKKVGMTPCGHADAGEGTGREETEKSLKFVDRPVYLFQ